MTSLRGGIQWVIILCSWSVSLASCLPSQREKSQEEPLLEERTQEKKRVYLYVASSLDHFITQLNELYHQTYPQTKVISSLVGSQTARLQLSRGAPAGVFISAGLSHITQLAARGKIVRHQPLAINHISLITHKNSSVHSLETLINGKGFAIGVEQVPVGHYTWSLLRLYQAQNKSELIPRLRPLIKTQEVSARALKARLQRGEVESAFLYRSDQAELRECREVTLPSSLNDKNQVVLHISLTRSGPQERPQEAARAWYALALSSEGQALLQRLGLEPFQSP